MRIIRFLHLFTHRHIHSFIHHHNLVERRGTYGILYSFSVCIAVSLLNGFPAQFLHTTFGIFVLGILQLHNITVLHVRINVQQRAKEDISITRLRVLFGNGTVESVLCRHGKSKAMNIKLSFLLVALRTVTFQTVGNVAEVGLPVSPIGKRTG